MNLNSVTIAGRLTADPQLRYTQSGVAVATFTLAINRPFTNAQGENEADFINVVIWRKPAENVANYLKKGDVAGAVGRIQTRSYEGQDGKRVYVVEIMAESVQFGAKKESGNDQSGNTQNGNASQNNRNKDPFVNNGEPIEVDESDLPF